MFFVLLRFLAIFLLTSSKEKSPIHSSFWAVRERESERESKRKRELNERLLPEVISVMMCTHFVSLDQVQFAFATKRLFWDNIPQIKDPETCVKLFLFDAVVQPGRNELRDSKEYSVFWLINSISHVSQVKMLHKRKHLFGWMDGWARNRMCVYAVLKKCEILVAVALECKELRNTHDICSGLVMLIWSVLLAITGPHRRIKV